MPSNKVNKPSNGSGSVQTPPGTGGDAGGPQSLPKGPRSVAFALLRLRQAPVRDIDVPTEPYPNILHGQRILSMTSKQWHQVYHHVQDLIRDYFLSSEAHREATYGGNPENHHSFILPIEARFPVLQRCKENWGVKWIIKKAKHAVSVKFSHERREECLQRARDYETARKARLEMEEWQQATIGDGGDDGGDDSDAEAIGERSVKPAEESVPRGGMKERQRYLRPRPARPLRAVPNSNNQRMNKDPLVPREDSRGRQQYAVKPHSTVAYGPNTNNQYMNQGSLVPGEDMRERQLLTIRPYPTKPIHPLQTMPSSNNQCMNPGPVRQAPRPSNAQVMPGLGSTGEAPRPSITRMSSSCQVPGRSSAQLMPRMEAPPSTKRVNVESIHQYTGLSSAQLVPELEATRQVPRPSSTQFADFESGGEVPGPCCYQHTDQGPSHQLHGPPNIRSVDIGSDHQVSGPCCGQHVNVGPSCQVPEPSSAEFTSGLQSIYQAAGPSSAHASTTSSSRLVPRNPIRQASVHKRAFPYSQSRSAVISGAVDKRPVLPPIRISTPARVIPGLVLPPIAEMFPELEGEVCARRLFPVSDLGRMACDAMLRENGPWLAGTRRASRFIWK